jgi:hypothetical protein
VLMKWAVGTMRRLLRSIGRKYPRAPRVSTPAFGYGE